MTGYKFESTEQYLHWCADMVNRIYTANFTRESARLSPSYVAKLVALAAEVSSKLDVSEGYDLIKADGTNYEDVEDDGFITVYPPLDQNKGS